MEISTFCNNSLFHCRNETWTITFPCLLPRGQNLPSPLQCRAAGDQWKAKVWGIKAAWLPWPRVWQTWWGFWPDHDSMPIPALAHLQVARISWLMVPKVISVHTNAVLWWTAELVSLIQSWDWWESVVFVCLEGTVIFGCLAIHFKLVQLC